MRALVILVAASGIATAAGPEIAGCPVFPSNNIWNTPVDALAVSPASSRHIGAINPGKPLHPDFGQDPGSGIPFNIAEEDTRRIKLPFEYADESDSGTYPIPSLPKIEAGSDHHMLIVDGKKCILYELFEPDREKGAWKAVQGSIFNLRSNNLRPDGWTSADAAGLPILPGLVRFEEVQAGEIAHAIRFTVSKTRKEHVWPARHDASPLQGAEYMPLGARLRLKAGVDISAFSPANQAILRALKKYGMILADTGSDWYISGVPDPRWNDSDLHHLTRLKGQDFEEVDTLPLRASEDSGEARIRPAKK
jgi:hypothetical protein